MRTYLLFSPNTSACKVFMVWFPPPTSFTPTMSRIPFWLVRVMAPVVPLRPVIVRVSPFNAEYTAMCVQAGTSASLNGTLSDVLNIFKTHTVWPQIQLICYNVCFVYGSYLARNRPVMCLVMSGGLQMYIYVVISIQWKRMFLHLTPFLKIHEIYSLSIHEICWHQLILSGRYHRYVICSFFNWNWRISWHRPYIVYLVHHMPENWSPW